MLLLLTPMQLSFDLFPTLFKQRQQSVLRQEVAQEHLEEEEAFVRIRFDICGFKPLLYGVPACGSNTVEALIWPVFLYNLAHSDQGMGFQAPELTIDLAFGRTPIEMLDAPICQQL
jgi:hypothetical protein